MRLDTEALKELVREIAGKDVVPLVELLKDKVNISEFVLADKLKITVNQVRNMLYRLYSYNLVTFTRKKDKKKGWYIYYWTFDNYKAREEILNLKKRKIENLKRLLERERDGNFFICPDKCMRMKSEDAMEHGFKCTECGKVLEAEDNVKKIERIEKEIKDIEESLEKELVIPEPVKREKKVKKVKKKIKKFKKKIKKVKKKKIKKKIKKTKKKKIKKIKKKVKKKKKPPEKKKTKKKKSISKKFLKKLNKKIFKKKLRSK